MECGSGKIGERGATMDETSEWFEKPLPTWLVTSSIALVTVVFLVVFAWLGDPRNDALTDRIESSLRAALPGYRRLTPDERAVLIAAGIACGLGDSVTSSSTEMTLACVRDGAKPLPPAWHFEGRPGRENMVEHAIQKAAR
jgi:hypothetical protein